jgi:hypothetical protein
MTMGGINAACSLVGVHRMGLSARRYHWILQLGHVDVWVAISQSHYKDA